MTESWENIKNTSGMKSWTFAYVADIHVGSPRSYRFQPAWNENWETAKQQIVASNPEFLLVGGDLTRDGATHKFELEQVKSQFDQLPFPVHVIPGNHEVGNKFNPNSAVSIQPKYLSLYHSVFGKSQWTFQHKNVRISGFDAFLLGTNFPQEKSLRNWLEAQTKLPQAPFHIWMIHPALFADSFDEPDFEITQDPIAWYFSLDKQHREYLFEIFKATHTTHVITAHIHCARVVNVAGIQVIFAPSTAFLQWQHRWEDGDARLGFLRFEVSSEDINFTLIPLTKESSKIGYGPGGNPTVEQRNYQLAWEKPSLKPHS